MLHFNKYFIIKCICIFGLFTIVHFSAVSQIIPSKLLFETIEMPLFAKDSIVALESRNPNNFAFPFYVDIDVKSTASAVMIEDTIFYSLQIVSKHAYSLNVIFGTCYLPKGASILIKNPNNSYTAGPYNNEDVTKNHTLPTPLIQGDTLQIIYKEPVNSSDIGILKISKISHDYKGNALQNNLLKAEAQACNVNINCSTGNSWQNEKRSVLRLLIDGTSLCTGTLINNTARNSTPYVITANHCLNSQSEAANTVFYFNYEYQTCTNDGTINNSQTLFGADLIAKPPSSELDFTLLKMDAVPPADYKPYYAGWDVRGQTTSNVVCIHHPRGDAKKISVSNESIYSDSFMQYNDNSHWHVPQWTIGTTESGSSGSALFNSNHQIIGVLSGGEAECGNSVNDYFAKLSVAWDNYSNNGNQLKAWLDPINSGLQYCNGFDPNAAPNYIVTNITTMDSVSLYNFDTIVHGTWTGENNIGWNLISDYISYAENKKIYAITFLGKIDTTQDLSNIIFKVWDGTIYPQNILYKTELSMSNIVDSITVTIIPDVPINTDGSFWFGYEVKNKSTAFKGFMAKPRNAMNTLYVNHPKEWITTDKIGCYTSLACVAYTTNNSDTLTYPIIVSSPFFLLKVSTNESSYTPKELFAIDSVSSIRDTTRLVTISSEYNVSNWAGPNELDANCFANLYTINSPIYIRGIKYGIYEIPDTNQNIIMKVWNSDFSEILSEKIVSCKKLKENNFNQIHLLEPLLVENDFALGLCYSDSVDLQKNISLFQFYDSNTNITGYFNMNNEWWKYEDFDLQYNIAVQPIQCFSKFHYNPDSANILYYPINQQEEILLPTNNELIVYPNPTDADINLYFTKTRYKSVKVTIFSSQGICIGSQIAECINNKIPISFKEYNRGMYIVKIEFGNEIIYRKIIKK